MNMIRQLFRPAPSAPNVASPAPQAAAGPDSLTQMLNLLGGDLSELSTGDKLMALSGLLRSATRSGRRAGLTPQQVLGQVQQQQLGQLQGRMQVEQLRREAAARDRVTALRRQLAQNNPELAGRISALTDEQILDIGAAEIENQLIPKTFAPAEIEKIAANIAPPGSPAFNKIIMQYLAQPKTQTTPSGETLLIPGINVEIIEEEDSGLPIVAFKSVDNKGNEIIEFFEAY